MRTKAAVVGSAENRSDVESIEGEIPATIDRVRITFNSQTDKGRDSQQELWTAYLTTRDTDLRNQLVEHYLGCVDAVAWRMSQTMGRYCTVDELREYGVFGLIRAIERHRPTSGCADSADATFVAYAKSLIRGAILDELRRLDWLPRSVRSNVTALRTSQDDLRASLKRNPTTGEVANAWNHTHETTMSQTMEALQRSQLVSLDAHVSRERSTTLIDEIDTHEDQEEMILRRLDFDNLRDAIAALDPRKQAVIAYRYLDELTQSQVANALGISSTRVGQIEQAAIRELRALLSAGK